MAYIPLTRTFQPADAIATLVSHAIALRAEAERVMAQVNSITVGGTVGANLESYGVPAGKGATVYTSVHDSIYLNTEAMTASILADLDNG